MYNLWIFNGSANANFYFAVTLAFNTAQVSTLMGNELYYVIPIFYYTHLTGEYQNISDTFYTLLGDGEVHSNLSLTD